MTCYLHTTVRQAARELYPGVAAVQTQCAEQRSAVTAGRSLGRLLVCWLFLIVPEFAFASAPAGTLINNQATAQFLDGAGTTQTSVSNVVQAAIGPVAGFTLQANNSRYVGPGGTVTFPHLVVNSGNSSDTFALRASVQAGGFALGSIAIYADANGDGWPDSTTPISSTTVLAPGAAYQFVVQAQVPAGAAVGSSDSIRIDATSALDPTETSVGASPPVTPVIDVATVSGGAIVNATKAFSVATGATPSGPYTVTLRYDNPSATPASAVTLTDPLAAQLIYVPGSARWNGTGAAILTDTVTTPDDQGALPNTIQYDFGVTAPGAITAIIRQVPPGFAGFVTFQVNVAAGVTAGRIDNTATLTYNDGTGIRGPTLTNTASITVLGAPRLSMTGATVTSAVAGSAVLLTNTITNSGNALDSFDTTLGTHNFPSGTIFTLLQSDGSTALADSDGNGIPDTGLLGPGASTTVVVRAALPVGVSGGPFSIQKSARSKADPAQSATVSDTVSAVSVSGPALLSLTKSVLGPAPQPGGSLNYSLRLTNTGGAYASGPAPIVIDGQSVTPVLLRDAVPANTSFLDFSSIPAGATALYHQTGTAVDAYTAAVPADLNTVDAIALAWPTVPPGYAATLSFSVTIHPNAASYGSGQISNVATVNFLDGVNATPQTAVSNTATALLPAVAGSIRNFSGPDFAAPADFVPVGTTLYLQAVAASCNQNASLAETHIALITGPGGERESFTALETSPNSGVFVLTAVATRAPPVVAGDQVIEANNGDVLTVSLQGCASPVVNTIQLLDPAGVVFDSQTNAPLIGASVSLVTAAGGVCTNVPANVSTLVGNTLQPSPATVLTGADGHYAFPLVAPGDYCLRVTPPTGYGAPSVIPVASLPPGRRIVSTGPTAGGSYGGMFNLGPVTGPVMADIPLDARPINGLLLEKKASRTTAEVADFVDYQLQFKNASGVPIGSGTVLSDQLPVGFTYQKGSARLNGGAIPDPAGAAGPSLQFAIGAVAPNATAIISYRVRIGPAALQGDGINRAQAQYLTARSNVASARVELQGGVFSDQGFVLGKVFLDCNRDRAQDQGELGVPGVRLYLEDGTSVVTDSEGKYSLYGISPRTHVLKIDSTTLPADSELINLSNRNAGDAQSAFVDLKAGELHKQNFAEGSCTAAIRADVMRRRAKAEVLVPETARSLSARLDTDASVHPLGDVRALPASGTAGAIAAGEQSPSTSMQTAPATPGIASSQEGPGVDVDALSSARVDRANVEGIIDVPMERLLVSETNQLGFMGLNEGDTLPRAQMNVRVKGKVGDHFVLAVNGREIAQSRVGKKSTLGAKSLLAWEYIGVELAPGANRLDLRALDAQGNERGHQALTVVAPDQLGRVTVSVTDSVPADGHSAAHIEVLLTDAHGVPVTARTPLTLEATLGRWDMTDLDPKEPGIQVFIEGGRADFPLLAPADPGASQVRVSSGVLAGSVQVDFLPDLRPLIAAGVIEGVINVRHLDSRALVPANAQDTFERELRQWSARSGDGSKDAAARAALFLKGKVRGSYLLTAGLDTDKDARTRLFRDIQPDQFYPVYGDASVRGFDAQSSGRLYVRVDHRKSYLLYGDFTTQSTSEALRLGNYSRSLNGLREHYETERAVVNVFASQDGTRQVIDELPANGTSGPFTLSVSQFVENSEKVEILLRDRNQPALILSTQTFARFADYEVEPLTGRILLRTPLASVDANFNPQSIRVSYEVDQAGNKFWVAGVDARYKLGKVLAVGGAFVDDRNPSDPSQLRDLNAAVRLASHTQLVGEFAQTDKLSTGVGRAGRVELKHDGSDLKIHVFDGKADAQYNNPGSSLNQGRAEAGARVQYRVRPGMVLKGEALRTSDTVSRGARVGVFASIDQEFKHQIHVEMGVRRVATDVPATAPIGTPNVIAPAADFTSLRLKLSAPIPNYPKAGVYGEYEQDIQDNRKKLGAVGGDYQFATRGRLYARHEFLSSLSGPYSLNTSQKQNATVVGLDTDYFKDAHLFSEYRQRDAFSGGDTEAAIGLRNQWTLQPGLRLQTSAERVHTLAGAGSEEATAGTIGLEYTAHPTWKGTGRLELRNATMSNSLLSTIGVAAKLDRNWTLLTRGAYALTRNKGSASGERLQDRYQAGIAYRDVDADVWNALARIEHTDLRDTSNPLLDVFRRADVVSISLNDQPTKPLVISARLAAKWATDHSNGLDSRAAAQLLSTRATYDVTARWDVSLMGGMLMSDHLRTRQFGLGAEAGYLITGNLWLSLGYNLFGYQDVDLASADYTSRGVFLRLRFKFDESIFASRDSSSSVMHTDASRGASAP